MIVLNERYCKYVNMFLLLMPLGHLYMMLKGCIRTDIINYLVYIELVLAYCVICKILLKKYKAHFIIIIVISLAIFLIYLLVLVLFIVFYTVNYGFPLDAIH